MCFQTYVLDPNGVPVDLTSIKDIYFYMFNELGCIIEEMSSDNVIFLQKNISQNVIDVPMFEYATDENDGQECERDFISEDVLLENATFYYKEDEEGDEVSGIKIGDSETTGNIILKDLDIPHRYTLSITARNLSPVIESSNSDSDSDLDSQNKLTIIVDDTYSEFEIPETETTISLNIENPPQYSGKRNITIVCNNILVHELHISTITSIENRGLIYFCLSEERTSEFITGNIFLQSEITDKDGIIYTTPKIHIGTVISPENMSSGWKGKNGEWIVPLKGDSAYTVAVQRGYKGTVDEWLESLQGDSAYQVAVERGYVGTEDEWLASLKGDSAYQVYVETTTDVPVKTPEEWLASYKAYYAAVQGGYQGTEEQFNKNLSNVDNKMIIRDYTIEEE